MRRILGFIAALALLPAPALAAPASVTGLWRGSYVCNQGNTALDLQVTEISPGLVEALFYFHAAPDNPYVPKGCFLMQGRYDPASGQLALTASSWLLHPWGYVTVDLRGQAADGTLSGLVDGPNCTSFSLVQMDGVLAGAPARCNLPLS